MGAPIGQIPSALIAARQGPPVIEPLAPRGDRANFSLTQSGSTGESNPNQPGNTPATETPEPGFGPGTVSGPAAALVALGRGVRAARQAVPTLDDIRAQFQASRAARATQRAAQLDALRTRLAERRDAIRQPAVPAPDTLGFNRFNEARGFTEVPRPEPVQPAPPQSERPQETPQLASARPPEAPQFASAPQPNEQAPPPPPEPAAGAGPVPDAVQRRRFDLTA